MAKSKAKAEHYVNNKEFLAAMVEYKKTVDKAKKAGKKNPRVPDYVGECFLKIANHLSYRPNFINYTYRDDMISDGIENCLQASRAVARPRVSRPDVSTGSWANSDRLEAVYGPPRHEYLEGVPVLPGNACLSIHFWWKS